MFVHSPLLQLRIRLSLSSLILSSSFPLFWPYAVTVSATVMLYNDSLPSTLTSVCSDALLADVAACDPLVKNLRPDFFYPPESLSRVCTDNCSSSLAAWMSSVWTSCGNQTVLVDPEFQAAAVYIPGSLQYSFQSACLQDDNGRYCSPVAALAVAFSDPGVSPFNYISNITEQDKPDDCDLCIAERLRLRAGSPYFDGPIVASESLYESMTSRCSIANRHIVRSTLGYYTATPTRTASACEGSVYTLKPLDDCYTVSKKQGVGTAWLLADNDLDAYCNNFPAAGTLLCITNKCTTVTVGVNETCAAISSAANITEAQFHAWNPVINYACSNLKQMNGSEVCVVAPGRKFVAPTNTSNLPPTTPTMPVAMPTDAADGSGGKPCGKWYKVQHGDYCNLLTLKFRISLTDFRFLNSGVNTNCTNLFAEESYCVQAVGDINTYSGRPGYMSITTNPNATFTGIPFTRLSNATASPYARLYTPLPIAAGTRDDCIHYFAGDDYQVNLTGSTFASPCLLAVAVYSVDLDSFASWNIGLGDVTSLSCAFEMGVRYCGSWHLQSPDEFDDVTTASDTETPTRTTAGPAPPAPTMSGEPENCNRWAVVEDGVTCSNMAAAAGISLAQFLTWNPAVSEDCLTNYWVGEAYCVGVSAASVTKTSASDTAPTTTTATPTVTKPPSNYRQAGQPDNCTSRNGLTVSELAGLNPVLGMAGANCATQMWLDYYYCVAVVG
ncbi:carbohydrate-binding module family 50 protein [Daldinia sp. EC12]|nr:carbohydrate-binding module family 50 protein [Daldinia sp. EC12]